MLIKIGLDNGILNLKLNIVTSQNTVPVYIITLFGKIITKIFNRLLKYYS